MDLELNNMQEKIKLTENLGIIVNNLCNLTCSHCTGLALYDFLGTFKWTDWEHRYKKWAELIDVDAISFAGGEPYLHPELELWFDNIRNLWPTARLEMYTNGTRLSRRKELSRKFIADGNTNLIISCHDESMFDQMHQDALDILKPWIDQLRKTEKEHVEFQQPRTIKYFLNNVPVCTVQQITEMAPPYHKIVDNGTLYFEMNGDQEESHSKCPWRDNYTLQHGLLYKCTALTNYPEAKLQVKFEDEAVRILDQHPGCDPFDDTEIIKKFINNLPNSVSACSLCAFDKQKDTLSLSRKVVLDPSKKTKMRQFKIKQI